MKQIILNIPDKKYPFFMELVKSLKFVKIEDKKKLTGKQKKFIEGLNDSLNEVEKHMQGKIRLKTADQLLNEL